MRRKLLFAGTFVLYSVFCFTGHCGYSKIYVKDYKFKISEGKSIEISNCGIASTSRYIPGQTFDLEFDLNFLSGQYQFCGYIEFYFPSGITVNHAEDFALEWNGETGEGAMVSWGNGRDIIRENDSWLLNVTVSPFFMGDFNIGWEMTARDTVYSSGMMIIEEAFEKDIAIYNIYPSEIIYGNEVNTVVVIENKGYLNRNDFSVTLSDSISYFEQVDFTGSIEPFEMELIEFPEWVPVENCSRLTGTILFPDDEDSSNNRMTIKVNSGEFGEAGICSKAVDYGELNGPSKSGLINHGNSYWFYIEIEEISYDVKFSLCGSFFDTRMEIWKNCYDVKPWLFNDDGKECMGPQSEIFIEMLPAGIYYIKINFNDTAYSGDFTLTITSALKNDLAVIGASRTAFVNHEILPEIVLKNLGAEPQSLFNVRLSISNRGSEVYSSEKNFDVEILHGETKIVKLDEPWTPVEMVPHSVIVELETVIPDDNPENNILDQDQIQILNIDRVLSHYVNNSMSGSYYLGSSRYESLNSISGYNTLIKGGTYAGDMFYIIHGTGRNIKLTYYNETIKAWKDLRVTGNTGHMPFYCLAYDKNTDVFYTLATDSDTNIVAKSLFEIDKITGTARKIADFTNPLKLVALAADNNGKLYALGCAENGRGLLYQICKNTAELTLRCNITGNVEQIPQAMVFHPHDNTCYFQAYSNGSALNGTYLINTSTGQITKTGETLADGYNNGHIIGLGIKNQSFHISRSSISQIMVDIYPNPSGGSVNIIVSENSMIMVTDVTGKKIQSFNVNKYSPSCFSLPRGMYFIQVDSGKEISVHKLLVTG